MPDKPSAEEFRKQWSHKPTPIPPDATGLWYSVECVDQMLSDYAAHLEQALRESREEVERLKGQLGMAEGALAIQRRNYESRQPKASQPASE